MSGDLTNMSPAYTLAAIAVVSSTDQGDENRPVLIASETCSDCRSAFGLSATIAKQVRRPYASFPTK
jgi:hypothetical protein